MYSDRVQGCLKGKDDRRHRREMEQLLKDNTRKTQQCDTVLHIIVKNKKKF